jgi:hypothetical protein
MRGLLMAGGLAAVVALSGGFGAARPPAAADETYDLRGPAPKVNQEFVNKMTLTIKDADAVLKVGEIKLDGTMSMVVTGEEEAKVLAVDGRNVTKCRTKIVKEQAEITANIGGVKQNKTEPTALQGEIVISTRVGDKWKHALLDTQPTDKQKKELDSRNGIENEDDLYPAEKVKVGHEWKVDAKALTKLFGNSFTEVKGELKQKFVKVEDVGGEECAVIESSGLVKGKMKDDDGEPTLNMEMDLKVKTWRSIKTGVEVKGTFEGKIKLTGTQKVDDQNVEVNLSGPFTGTSATKLK